MKIVKIISFESAFFTNAVFRSVSTDDNNDGENRFMIYLGNELAGSVSVFENEIRKMNFKIGTDEKYILKHTVKILERYASKKG
jgi:hypothetical protein